MSTSKKHIGIRAIVKKDRNLLAKYANNIRFRQYLRDSMPFPYTLKDADNFISMVLTESPLQTFAITLNSKFVGVCGLHLQEGIYRKSCEIGYWVADKFWGKGVATEALNLVTNFAFSELDMARIFTGVFDYNITSIRVLEKCGYKKEGIFKMALIKDGKYYDEVRYARLR